MIDMKAGMVIVTGLLVASACGPPPEAEAVDAGQGQWQFRVEARRVVLDTSVTRVIGGETREIREVVEFELTAEAPMPVMAFDPVLVIGTREVREYHYGAANALVFTEFEPDQLPAEEMVRFRWGPATADSATAIGFRFRRGDLPTVRRPNLRRPRPRG